MGNLFGAEDRQREREERQREREERRREREENMRIYKMFEKEQMRQQQMEERKRQQEMEEQRKQQEAEVYLNKPWRSDINVWDNATVAHLKISVMNAIPEGKNITQFNILLIGEKKSGKSSFINTVHSTLVGKYEKIAISAEDQKSVTKQFTVYELESQTREPLKINICDTMGQYVSKEYPKGPRIDEFNKMLKGEIMDGYKFNDKSGDQTYMRKNPTFNDMIHCVGIVVDANAEDDTVTMNTLLKYGRVAKGRGISTRVIMTKVDEVSDMVKKDTALVHHSSTILKCVRVMTELVGVDTNDVFPVRNTTQEYFVSIPEQILSLVALERLVEACKDTLRRKK